MVSTQLQIVANLKDNVSGKLKGMQGKVSGFGRSIAGLGAQLGLAFGGAALLKGLVQTNAQFDKLEAQISTFTGSAEEAASAMALIQDITSKTPFQLNEVTTAFTRMKALGLNPTKEALLAFGDVAAGSGKSILQFTEAVADAAVGEFERLKEFGVKASAQGDEVAFTFKGVTTTVKKNSQEIQKYLTEMGQNNFGGAMAKQMDTMEGAWSNAKDQFALLARAIGEAGLNDLIKSFAQAMGTAAKFITEKVGVIQAVWAAFVLHYTSNLEYMRHASSLAWLGIKLIFLETANFISETWTSVINEIIDANNAMADTWVGQKLGIEHIEKATNSWSEALDGVYDAIRDETKAHDANIISLQNEHDAKIDNLIATENASSAVRDYSEYEDQNTKSIEAATIAAERQAAELDKKATVYEKLTEQMKEHRIVADQSWDAMEKLDQEFINGTITAEEYGVAMEVIEHNLGLVNDQLSKTTDKADKVETVFSRMFDRIKDGRVEITQTKEAIKGMNEAFERGDITAKEHADSIKRLNENLGITVKEAKKVDSVYEKTTKSIKDNRIEVVQTHDAIEKLNGSYDRGEISYREYTNAMKDYESTLYSAGDATGELLNANTNLESSFGELFDNIIRGSDDVRGSLRKLIASFVEYIFAAGNASKAAPFNSVAGGSASGILSGAGDFVGKAVGGITNFLGGLFKADGGPVMSNMPYIVGERGPEVFVPKTAGDIKPNGSFGGGGPINISISALDGSDVMRVLTQNRREISELVAGTTRTYGI